MVIASIHLKAGKAVQLKQRREKVLEGSDPLALAKDYNRYGEVAVIDLDAAMGIGSNQPIVKEICKIAECRVGGGIRSVEKAKEVISYGAAKVIVGTKAFEKDSVNHEFLGELGSAVGNNRIIIAVDALNQTIVTKGWKHNTGLDLFDVVKEVEQYASEFLFTCVEKEGLMLGTDVETINKLRNATQNRLTVAGGISTTDEIVALAKMGVDVQIGMTPYTGRIKLEDAFIEPLNWGKELIPTVTCDIAGQVLMLAYTSKESLRKTFETGNMWYFSRTRNKLWMKGETSGNIQQFVRMRADCDMDALLAIVRQQGVACHTGSYSCFGDKRFSLHELCDVIKDRLENPVPGAYTATLTDKLVREKILEEAEEVIEASGEDEMIWEAADLIYFLVVLLTKKGVKIDDVFSELSRRRRG